MMAIIPESEYIQVVDKDGCTANVSLCDGIYYPAFPGIKKRLAELTTFEARDGDVVILAYPKSGTHWVWNMARMLSSQTTEHVTGEKLDEFIELVDQETLKAASSPRILNTHIRPCLLPVDMVRRKCKMIYIHRNPKDVFVSFFYHVRNLTAVYGYEGNFSGFFELMLSSEMEAGSWFDYTLSSEKFFNEHPDIPVLRLHYEDMKQDLLSNVRKIATFCGFLVVEDILVGISEGCTFSNLKKAKLPLVDEIFRNVWRNGQYDMYRKGETGDWKNYFTVAQNERFEAECKRRLEGSGVEIKWAN